MAFTSIVTLSEVKGLGVAVVVVTPSHHRDSSFHSE
jgi:hypothetical protein